MKQLFILSAFLLLMQSAWAQEKEQMTFSGVDSIKCKFVSGSLEVRKSASSDVIIEVKYSFSAESFKPLMKQEGKTLNLKEEFLKNSNSGSSQWTFYVPDGVTITHSTASGDVSVAGLNIKLDMSAASSSLNASLCQGDWRISTGSGNINLKDFSGKISVGGSSGNIKMSSISFTDKSSVSTASGNIDVSLEKAWVLI